MTQQTLFGGKQDKKLREQLDKPEESCCYNDNPEIEVGKVVKDDKYGWKQLEGIKGKEYGKYYTSLELITRTDLGGSKYYVSQSVSSEHPKGMLGSMWGGGECFNPKNLDEVKKCFESIMEIKKHRLQEKYREFTDEETKISYDHHNVYYLFRLIPAKNFFVIISDSLVELLKKTGFDFESWYKKYKTLPENMADEKDWDNALEVLKLYKKGDKIIDEIKEFNDIKDGKKDNLLYKNEDINKNIKKLPHSLKEVADEIENREGKLGHFTYSKPFWWELKKYGVDNGK